MTTPTGSKLTVREAGWVVPLESTLDIKTRVFHKPLEIHEVAAQLWISQTPKLVRAYHLKGQFHRPEVEDVSIAIKTWEDRNQTDLKKLAALIRNILEVMKGSSGRAIVKYDNEEDKLVVWESERGKILREDLYSKWDDAVTSASETTTEH